jgi:cytochrome c biogenesis protein CcdA
MPPAKEQSMVAKSFPTIKIAAEPAPRPAYEKVAASGCFAFGAVTIVVALMLSLISYLDTVRHDRAETLMYLAALALFGLGAHLLDCHDERKVAGREK